MFLLNPFIHGEAAFSPLDISDCVAWWDADDAATITTATGVSQWTSKATGSINLAQADTTQQPGQTTVGGRNMISFDGTNDYLDAGDPAALQFGTGDFSIAIVYRTNDTNRGTFLARGNFAPAAYTARINNADTNNGEFFVFLRDTGSDSASISAGATSGTNYNDNTVRLAVITRDSANLRQYQDGSEVTESPASTAAVGDLDDAQGFTVGAIFNETQFLDGEIGEIIIYSKLLSAGERTQLTDYLTTKWGI